MSTRSSSPSSLTLLQLLLLVIVATTLESADAKPAIATCPGRDVSFTFFHQDCFNETHFEVQFGFCHADGTREQQEEDLFACEDETPHCVVCHDPVNGHKYPTCAKNPETVCPHIEQDLCVAQDPHEYTEVQCRNEQAFDYHIVSCANSTTQRGTQHLDCRDEPGENVYCYNCGSVQLCANHEGASCAHVLTGKPQVHEKNDQVEEPKKNLSTSNNNDKDKDKRPALAVFVTLLVVGLVAGAAVFMVKRNRRRRQNKSSTTTTTLPHDLNLQAPATEHQVDFSDKYGDNDDSENSDSEGRFT